MSSSHISNFAEADLEYIPSDVFDSSELFQFNLQKVIIIAIIGAGLIFIRLFYGRNLISVIVVITVIIFRYYKRKEDEKMSKVTTIKINLIFYC